MWKCTKCGREFDEYDDDFGSPDDVIGVSCYYCGAELEEAYRCVSCDEYDIGLIRHGNAERIHVSCDCFEEFYRAVMEAKTRLLAKHACIENIESVINEALNKYKEGEE